MQTDGGGAKLLITCGCLFYAGSIAAVLLISIIFAAFGDDEIDIDKKFLEQMSEDRLTEDGKEYLKDHQEAMKDNKLWDAALQKEINWTVLEAIYKGTVESDEQDSCDDHWIGPMKMKELNWSGNQLLNEFPNAKTNFSNCGDIHDDYQDYLTDVERLKKYNEQSSQNKEDCIKRAREEKKEQFCEAYGEDGDQDEKADPNDEPDAFMSAANLLGNYKGIYGNLGQALNIAYGENEKFLRAVKNQVIAWYKDPSEFGILRWPVNPDQAENKVVTQRGETGLTIKAKDGEAVFAVGTGEITEVDSNATCGVKLTHQFEENNQRISTLYCNLKEIKVKKGDFVNIHDEIGKVGQQPLTIKIIRESGNESEDENNRDNQDVNINPEEYLTAPNDVKFEEQQGQEEQ